MSRHAIRWSSALLLLAPGAAAQTCQPSWASGFTGSDIGQPFDFAVFDDGTGPALYAAGGIGPPAYPVASAMARWTGSGWQGLASPIGDGVRRLCTATVQGSPALYAGGVFTTAGGQPVNRIARYDGVSWAPLGDGVNNLVGAMAEYDDGLGGGPALYVGGNFTAAGGQPASHIAKWTGTAWVPLNVGVDGNVTALAVFDDDGPGPDRPALYVGGSFATAGGVPASNIAQWDGVFWQPVGSGQARPVTAMAAYNGQLYVAGSFNGGMARWTGQLWQPVGPAVSGGVVNTLAVGNDGSGPALFAGGTFTQIGSTQFLHAAKWNGIAWSPLPGYSTGGNVDVFWAFNDGSGEKIYSAGPFLTVGNHSAKNVARWNGAEWLPLPSRSVNGEVRAMCTVGQGPAASLIVAGFFDMAGPLVAWNIARWDGAAWSPLGSGTDGRIYALAPSSVGGAPSLYAAGIFFNAGGQPAAAIARWDGASWSPLGPGLSNGSPGNVWSLAEYDNGAGPRLYAGGHFTNAGALPVSRIAVWNGQAWAPVGSGMDQDVHTMLVFNDGSGPKLYAGGSFTTAGGVSARGVARWDGAQWSRVGTTGGPGGTVLALAAFNDPGAGGPGLYAAGTFQSADGVLAMNIARWDGTAWSPLGQGIGNSSSAVWRLEVYDDGNGPALYAMGSFFEAGGQPVAKLVRWKDSVWSEVGGGIQPANGIPYTSTRFGPPGEVPALWIGGNFGAGGTTPSANVAAWRGCPPCPANCDRSTIPPILNVNDFQCFLNRFASGDPSANCDGSTIPPVLNVNDFQCFLNLFAAGCP